MNTARLARSKAWIMVLFCSLAAASASRQLLQSAYSNEDFPVTDSEVLLWNVHLFAKESSTDMGLIQYLNRTTPSGALEVSTTKNVEWQIAQPGPFSLIMLEGAACAQYTISSSGACNMTSAFLVDNTVAQVAADEAVPLSQLDSMLSVPQPEGILTSSICDVDCEDHLVGLSATSSYDFVLNGESDDVCDITTTFTAYDNTSPVCSSTVSPANSQMGTVAKLLDNVTVWASEGNFSFIMDFNNASAWTFQNASCMFSSIYLPSDPSMVLSHLTLSLMKVSDYASVLNGTDGTADISKAAGGIIASCKGVQCNATDSQWLAATNLVPQTQYVVVISHDDELAEVPSDTSSGFVLLQIATADKCPAPAPAPVPVPAPAPVNVPVPAPAPVNTPVFAGPVSASLVSISVAPADSVSTSSIDSSTSNDGTSDNSNDNSASVST